MLTKNTSVDIGSFRALITIQKRSDTPDEYGQLSTTWEDVTTLRAKIASLNQRETYSNGQLVSQVTHIITFRYSPYLNVTAGMRVKYGSRVFDVQAPDNADAKNILMKLLVLEVTA